MLIDNDLPGLLIAMKKLALIILDGFGIVGRDQRERLAGGTGAAFALIPAQNATGNWVKVVQRLPVRIQLDPAQLKQHPLRVGLSMTATIDTRDQ